MIACLRPVWLLQLVILFSIFEAAAILVLGSFGLQPALLPAMIFTGYIVLQLLLGVRYVGRNIAWWTMLPFLFVVGWAVIGSWMMPRIFAGEVYVWPQKFEPPFVALPLEPNGSNMNQVLYLVVDAFVLVTSALYVSGSKAGGQRILKAYLLSGLVSALLGFWQLSNKLAGVPYPEILFFSNPGWAILSEQSIGLAPRINATFSEPAAFASYLVGVLGCIGWLILQGEPGWKPRVLFAIVLMALLCSTSTTGYVVLALMLAGLPTYAVATRAWHLLIRSLAVFAALATLLGVIYIGVSEYSPEANRVITQVLDSSLNKGDSSSFSERTSTDADSFNLVIPTYGLGVGWGSNRSSSLVPGLLANLGLWGCLALVWFAMRLRTVVSRAHQLLRPSGDKSVLSGATGATVGYIAAGVVSGPTITSAAFYLLLGAMIGTASRVLVHSDPRRARSYAASTRPSVNVSMAT